MANNEINVAVVQMTSVDDVRANLKQVRTLIDQIPDGTAAAFFPENSLYFRIVEGSAIPGLDLQDPALKELSGVARERRLNLHLTTAVWARGQLFNTSILLRPEGQIETVYQKIHLFDIWLSNGPQVRESDVFGSGPDTAVIEIDGWRFGESICYDLRFAELYSRYARAEVDAILVPSAFLVRTGQAHWEILLRARAIESQCYVLAPAQSGTHRASAEKAERQTHGRSLIVEPWGAIDDEAKEPGPSVLRRTLKRSELSKVRAQIPMKDHRRIQ